MTDHYETLGVDRDASPEQIKRAYRGKAKKAHPDQGGDRDEFERVNRSYLVLIDQDRRDRYDRTGDDEAAPAADAAQQLMLQVVDELLATIDEPWTIDVVYVAAQQLEHRLAGIAKYLDNLGARRRKLEKTAGRFKTKAKTNLLDGIVTQHLKALAIQEQRARDDEEITKRAYDLLKGYSFSVEEPQRAPFGFSLSTTTRLW